MKLTTAILGFLMVIGLVNCSSDQTPIGTNKLIDVKVPSEDVQIDSSILYVKEKIVHGKDTIKIIQTTGDFENITIINNDTALVIEKYVYNLDFFDFNQDGFTDILYTHNYNRTSYDLLLFNEASGGWERVKNIGRFESISRIDDAPLYYTYSRGGCADSYWNSYVIEIGPDYSAKKLGRIEGRGCSGGESNTGIFIYTITDDTQEPLDSFLRSPGYYEDKWEFIDQYWNENAREFAPHLPRGCSNQQDETQHCIECLTDKYHIVINGNQDEVYIVQVSGQDGQLVDEHTMEDLLRFERSKVSFCTNEYVGINTACGGPCSKIEVIYLDDGRKASYDYAAYVKGYDIIMYRKNEVFDSLYLRNLRTEAEISVKLDTCVQDPDLNLGICAISQFRVHDSVLVIDNAYFDRQLTNQEIDLADLLD